MKADITLEGGQDLLDCLLPGIDQHPRSKVDLSLQGNVVRIIIDASDAVAMRATTGSILQLITVFTKTKEIQ